ncbi:MAG TPA: alanine racemase [Acidimicrobiales bacterium]|nr:alanine racemase [Acidimicrobiales bacterium]
MADRRAEGDWRASWAEIDLDAVRHNVRILVERCAPASVCAVVKADAYGHGAPAVAAAALDAGAAWLAVALVEEGVVLRDAGVQAPVLLLAEPPPAAMGAVRAARLVPTLYTRTGVAAAAASAAPGDPPLEVHVKVDTGMHRVGADPADVVALARAVEDAPPLRLGGTWTHLAVADEPGQAAYTAAQLRRFDEVRAELSAAGIDPGTVHAANSAAALSEPASRYDLVRCGIAVYGYSPVPVPGGWPLLRPVLSLRSKVSLTRALPAGERISYGLRYGLTSDAVVATVPLGYADGVPRRLSAAGGQVLVGGRRIPMAGTVTMDQLMVDCGPGAAVAAGDDVVLLGRQGDEEIWADDWARRLDTIPYEIVCGIGKRVPRIVRNGPGDA